MGIGAYRHRVTLEHPAVVLNPAVWDCAVQSAANQVTDGLAAYFVRGRYHPGITLETRVIFEGRKLQIQSVQDIDERHVDLVLLCVEAVARGASPVTLPVITSQPEDVSITEGETATLTVVAAGTPPLAYQWTLAGVDVPGATDATYTTGPLTATAVYAVRVWNAYDTVTSEDAMVTVEAPPDYQETILADGASMYWPLDDPAGTTTVRDLVASADGLPQGSVTFGVAGPSAAATAANFIADNFDAYLSVPLTSIPASATVEAWFRATHAINAYILSNQWSASVPVVLVLNSAGAIGGTVNTTSVAAATIVADNHWHHAVLVIDGAGGVLSIYVDGLIRHTLSTLTFTGATSNQSTIGGNDDISAYFWDGDLADVAIYPRVLTETEIAQHYALRQGRQR